jgi:large conductance mechanosensitive channel
MAKLLDEFKAFAMRGNVIDLAVGVIIGAAFGRIVTSLVEDIIMPPIGKLVGNMDFTNLYVSLSDKVDAANADNLRKAQEAAATQPAVDAGGVPLVGGVVNLFEGPGRLPLAEAKKLGAVIAYGNFLTILLNFIIVAFCIFLVVKLMNKMNRKAPPPPAAEPLPTKDQLLLMEIRDALKARA